MEQQELTQKKKGHRSVLLYSALYLLQGAISLIQNFVCVVTRNNRQRTGRDHDNTGVAQGFRIRKTVAVGDYDSVKENQLVVTLDDDEMQAQLLQMEADYKSSEADILNAKPH